MSVQESVVSSLLKHFETFFGENNVHCILKDKTIRVRPMWIDGVGSGYAPDINTMLDTVESVVGQFDKDNKLYCVRNRGFLGSLPYFCIYTRMNADVSWNQMTVSEQLKHRNECVITIHHDNFF